MTDWINVGNGKVRMTPKGVHNSALSYSILDLVSNQDKSIYYIAKQDVPAGTSISNTNYWDIVVDMSDVIDVPHNYAFDGTDLSTVFTSAQDFHNAIAESNFTRIRVGDYWPITLSGTFRDYGSYTVPSGTVYYTDAALTTSGGTTSEAIEGAYYSTTAVSFKISSTTYYCAIGDCLNYYVRTLSNEVIKLEVAGINNYWRCGDSGDLSGDKPHVTLISRNCLPNTMKMRKANDVWESSTVINPWVGSALYKTLNDADYGLVKLISETNIGSYIYSGPNSKGMRVRHEIRASTDATAASNWAWMDRGKLFLPYEYEVWGRGIWGGITGYYVAFGSQYPLFFGSNMHIIKTDGTNACNWWTASAHPENSTNFAFVSKQGNGGSNGAKGAASVPICFVMV